MDGSLYNQLEKIHSSWGKDKTFVSPHLWKRFMKEKKNRDTVEPINCLYLAIRKATRSCDHHYCKKLSKFKIRPTQIHIMDAVDMYGPAFAAVISKELGMHRTTFGREALILEKKGYLDMVYNNEKRGKYFLSVKGKNLLASCISSWKECENDLISAVCGKDAISLAVFKKFLSNITEGLQDNERPKPWRRKTNVSSTVDS